MIDPKNIRDNEEKTWFLGTDLLMLEDVDDAEIADLRLMDAGVYAAMTNEYAALYVVRGDYKEWTNDLLSAGYSPYFVTVMQEAARRGYKWVHFDRDIQTEHVRHVPQHELTGPELAERCGIWNEHPEFPVSDWALEASNNNIRRGYWEWVANELKMKHEDEN